MARIRSIKPEFWTDGLLVRLPMAVRLFYIGLWNFADDYGVLEDDPDSLKLRVLPADDVDAHELVALLVQHGRLDRMITQTGQRVLVIRRWLDHQKIDKRSAGRWGTPDTFTYVADVHYSAEGPTESPPIPPNPSESLPLPPLEGKGMEGNGSTLAPAARTPKKRKLPFVGDAPRRDELFEAVCRACGIDWRELNAQGRGPLNRAVQAIRESGATPSDVGARAGRLKLKFPNAAVTAPSLAKHWAALGNGKSPPPADEVVVDFAAFNREEPP